MKINFYLKHTLFMPLLLALTFSLANQSFALAASPSGTLAPPAASITDATGTVWTVVVSTGLIYKTVKGVKTKDPTSGNVALILYFNGSLYQQTKSNVWWVFTGGKWIYHAPGDPRKWASSSPTPTPPSAPPPTAPVTGSGSNLPQKPITDFGVACNGTDQYVNVQKAFDATAAAGNYQLVVNCPVTINTGKLPNKTVFIGNNTTVSFSSDGVFYVNNVLQPAFAIMNSTNIHLYNWNIVYTGSLGVALPDNTGGKFNNETATTWLAQNRHIVFGGGQTSAWQDTYNTAAMFYIVGDDSNILFRGFHITAETVLKAGGASRLPISAAAGFVPAVFTLGDNWKSGTAAKPNVLSSTEKQTPQTGACPTDVTFDHITLDGTIMGFVGGGMKNISFTNITSIHYSDVQDENGNNIGGVVAASDGGPWTPPPHLFYLVNNGVSTPNIVNTNLVFTNIHDADLDAEGRPITYDANPEYSSSQGNPNRVGGPRDTAARMKEEKRTNLSGYALSIKLMCGVSAGTASAGTSGGCILTNYNSSRPDGFLAVSNLNNVTFNGVNAVFDSNYTAGMAMYRPGIWFPGGYSNLAFKNVTLTDVAAQPLNEPIGYSEGFYGLFFNNVAVYVNEPPRSGVDLYDNNLGQTSTSSREYYIGNKSPIKVGP